MIQKIHDYFAAVVAPGILDKAPVRSTPVKAWTAGGSWPRSLLISAEKDGFSLKSQLFYLTMVQKLSKCEVKAWLCWNLNSLPVLRNQILAKPDCQKCHFWQF